MRRGGGGEMMEGGRAEKYFQKRDSTAIFRSCVHPVPEASAPNPFGYTTFVAELATK